MLSIARALSILCVSVTVIAAMICANLQDRILLFDVPMRGTISSIEALGIPFVTTSRVFTESRYGTEYDDWNIHPIGILANTLIFCTVIRGLYVYAYRGGRFHISSLLLLLCSFGFLSTLLIRDCDDVTRLLGLLTVERNTYIPATSLHYSIAIPIYFGYLIGIQTVLLSTVSLLKRACQLRVNKSG